MKTIIALVLFSSVAYADLGVVVKSTGIVVSKEAYAGDVSGVPKLLEDRKLKDRSLSFDVYDCDYQAQMDVFNSVVVPKTQRDISKDRAREVLKSTSTTNTQKINALILIFDLDGGVQQTQTRSR